MTPEQKREQWLKRILPALAVLVVYFAIISGFVTAKSSEAKTQFMALKQQGIDEAALPGIGQEQRKIKDELAKLEQENKAIHEKLAASSSFLSQPESANVTVEKISVVLADNNLQVLEEKRNGKADAGTLPKSLRDTQDWLNAILAPDTGKKTQSATPGAAAKDLNIWTIRYIGNYLDNYRALAALLDSGTKALPVSLTMRAYRADASKQEWILTLWL